MQAQDHRRVLAAIDDDLLQLCQDLEDVASGRQYAAHGASPVDLLDLVGLVLAEGFQQTSLMVARFTEQQMQEPTAPQENPQLFSSLQSEPAALPDARVMSKFLLQFSDAARKSQGMAELKKWAIEIDPRLNPRPPYSLVR